jgi:hypothetical protein
MWQQILSFEKRVFENHPDKVFDLSSILILFSGQLRGSISIKTEPNSRKQREKTTPGDWGHSREVCPLSTIKSTSHQVDLSPPHVDSCRKV